MENVKKTFKRNKVKMIIDRRYDIKYIIHFN